MAITLSGVLKDAYGEPLRGAEIGFIATATSSSVLEHVDAYDTTDSAGSYTLSVESGNYDITIREAGARAGYTVGRAVRVNGDTTATTLNQLIVDFQGESNITPPIIVEFQQIAAEARGYRDEAQAAAAEATAAAGDVSADAAQVAADRDYVEGAAATIDTQSQQVATDAAQVAADRTAVAADTQDAQEAATTATTAAGNASQSETNADASALEAEHWAVMPRDTPVPEGDGTEYSAYHWAQVAEERAVNAVIYRGTWDASTGAFPTEPVGASYWLVTGAPDGVTVGGMEFRNKDYLLWNPGDPGSWAQMDNTDAVSSVNGQRGTVVLDANDVSADPAGTAAQEVSALESQLGTAAYQASSSFDAAGSAAAAQAYAIQRANHTGTQPASTISDPQNFFRIGFFINVKFFGVFPNSGADESVGINAAIEYAASNGIPSVVFDEGEYLVESDVKQRDGVALVGAGKGRTIIKAMDTMPMGLNVITNINNTGVPHTNYNYNLVTMDMTIDGNWQGRDPNEQQYTQQQTCCLRYATVDGFRVERVEAINGALHCFDFSASTYFNDGNINHTAEGPSLNGIISQCVGRNPQRDDAFTTHNSGRIKFLDCYAEKDSVVTPSTSQQGFEADEGSFDVLVIRCWAKGWDKGFQAKGHTTTMPARNVKFIDCMAEECSYGYDIQHLSVSEVPSGQVHVAENVDIIGCAVRNMRASSDYTECRIININGYKNVYVKTFTVEGAGNGSIRLDKTPINTVFDGVRFLDATTYTGGLIYGYSSLGDSLVTIKNLSSSVPQPCPAVSMRSSSTRVNIDGVECDGSDNTVPLIWLATKSPWHSVVNLYGTGWAGRIYFDVYATTYDNYIELHQNGLATMSNSSGNPEGVDAAPRGTHLYGRSTGRTFRKDSTDGVTGWVEIT